ncbi:zinc finger protein [Heptranchias perlo]|uniref:zinc finger protein n=1 Tax=Heptranchias perlo TaxID=212740 RepID=UPI00355AACF3
MKSAGTGDTELFTDSYCNICNAQLISESQRVAHYESKKHANKVRLYYMLHPEDGGPPSKKLRPDNPDSDDGEVDKNKCCTLCNMFFTSAIVAQSHYQGKTHAKRMRLVLGEASVPPRVTANESPPDVLRPTTHVYSSLGPTVDNFDSGKFCQLCSAWFNNPMMAQQHYEGKKHKKNAARAKLLEQLGETLDSEALRALKSSYTCNICNVILNSVEQFHAHLQGSKHQSNDEAKEGGVTEATVRPAPRGRGERVEAVSCEGRPAREKRSWREAVPVPVPVCGPHCGAGQGEDELTSGEARLQGLEPSLDDRGEAGPQGVPAGGCEARLGREKRSWGTAMRGWGDDQGCWPGLMPGRGENPRTGPRCAVSETPQGSIQQLNGSVISTSEIPSVCHRQDNCRTATIGLVRPWLGRGDNQPWFLSSPVTLAERSGKHKADMAAVFKNDKLYLITSSRTNSIYFALAPPDGNVKYCLNQWNPMRLFGTILEHEKSQGQETGHSGH